MGADATPANAAPAIEYDEDVAVARDAAADADRIRATTWGYVFPVDPVRIARRLGIDVLDAYLAPNVSGALIKKPGEDPTVFLNATDSPNRKRFTCAHEIAHFVQRSESVDEYEWVDLRGPLSAAGLEFDEIYANQFAAALLMPADEIRKLHRAGKNDIELAQYFDVSREAIQFRLKNLGLPSR
jgi:Zn-dependent peptidase ImmA (M78 family)